jgi:hypothetical protein
LPYQRSSTLLHRNAYPISLQVTENITGTSHETIPAITPETLETIRATILGTIPETILGTILETMLETTLEIILEIILETHATILGTTSEVHPLNQLRHVLAMSLDPQLRHPERLLERGL